MPTVLILVGMLEQRLGGLTSVLYAFMSCARMLLVAFSTHDDTVIVTIGEGILKF